MIGQLTGAVASEDAGRNVRAGRRRRRLRASGAARHARARAEANASERALTLYVHTHVREDALLALRLRDAGRQGAFRTLIGVSNVGPKMALALLSAMPADELARVVAAKDLARLVAIPGIGKKTAERLLLELKDKLGRPPARALASAATPPPDRARRTPSCLPGALTRMGYRPDRGRSRHPAPRGPGRHRAGPGPRSRGPGLPGAARASPTRHRRGARSPSLTRLRYIDNHEAFCDARSSPDRVGSFARRFAVPAQFRAVIESV